MSNKQMSRAMIFNVLERLRLIVVSENEIGYIIKDDKSAKMIEMILEDKDGENESKLLRTMSDCVNVSFSTSIAYLQVYHKVPHLFGWSLGVFLFSAFIVALILAYSVLSFYAKSDLLADIYEELYAITYPTTEDDQ